MPNKGIAHLRQRCQSDDDGDGGDDDALLAGAEASMALGEAGPATWAASAA
jgi:hypothetical protein